MIPVEEAQNRLLEPLRPVGAELVALSEALGRVLAEDVVARRTQPPFHASAMDGYAVRAADVARIPAMLRVIGSVPAGQAFAGKVGAGEAVRIFTGAPVPDGADAIVIQEDTERRGDEVLVNESSPVGKWVRRKGLDFAEGATGLRAGRRLGVRDVALAAAMNFPWLGVRRRPRVAILPTGDEIVMPGEPAGPEQIVSSNGPALAALVRTAGGEPLLLKVARDDADALREVAAAANGADLLVTTGGASVGEHDLVAQALGADGLVLDFWKIAMRPGKPLMVGRWRETPMIGMPGNPVSALVCGLLFLRPAVERLLGLEPAVGTKRTARLALPLGENDRRQDYLRAALEPGTDGEWLARPFEKQDSSMISLLAHADCLVVRPPMAPAARAGERVPIIPLDGC